MLGSTTSILNTYNVFSNKKTHLVKKKLFTTLRFDTMVFNLRKIFAII